MKTFCILFIEILFLSATSFAQNLLIKNVKIISAKNGSASNAMDILVVNGKIVQIGSIPEKKTGYRIINADGLFAMPGLIDLHVHVHDESELLTYLRYGITTVLNMDGSPEHLAWRNKSQVQHYKGSRMFTAGHTLDGPKPLNWMFWSVADTIAARKAVLHQFNKGYDLIKMYGTLSPDVTASILKTATSVKMPVAGHIPRQGGLTKLFKSSFLLAAHASDIMFSSFDHIPSDDEIIKLADQVSKEKLFVTTNLSMDLRSIGELRSIDSILSFKSEEIHPAIYSQWLPSNNRNLAQQDHNGYIGYLQTVHTLNQKFIRALQEKGAALVLGTDASTMDHPGISMWHELIDLEKAGLDRPSILKSATVTAGEFLQKMRNKISVGNIESGYMADLLLVRENPFSNGFNHQSIVTIVKSGHVFDVTELEQTIQQSKLQSREIKKLVVRLDSQLLNKDYHSSLKEIETYDTKGIRLFTQWVLGNKVFNSLNTNPSQALEIGILNHKLYKTHFATSSLLANVYNQRKEWSKAVIEARKALILAPTDFIASTHLQKAISAMESGTMNVTMEIIRYNYNQPIDTLTANFSRTEQKNWQTSQPQQISNMIGSTSKIWFDKNSSYGPIHFHLLKKNNRWEGLWIGGFGTTGKVIINILNNIQSVN